MFNRKKTYFKKKKESVRKMIWDLEFKRFKLQEIREEIRQLYSANKDKMAVLDTEIKSQAEKPTMEEGEIKRLDDKKVLLQRDIDRHESQMKDIDIEINGSKQTNEFPDGVEGIEQKLDGLHELHGMIQAYIKDI